MEFSKKCQSIQDYLRRYVWPWQTPEASPGVYPVGIDPNINEVVSKDFVAKAYQNQVELRDLRQALNEKMEECDRIREHWQAAIGKLSDLESSKETFMVDDAEMRSLWTQLHYNIKQLTMAYLHSPVSLSELTEEQVSLLKAANPMYQEFLSAKGQVHLFFQSLVWMHLTILIFRSPTIVWGEKISLAFERLLSVSHGSAEDYHRWRAETGGIIHKARGVHNKVEWNVKERLHSNILQFVSKETLSNEKHRGIIHRSVERIVDKAIEIAVFFNKSRCAYKLRKVAHREHFSPRTMEYDEECDAPQVDLMISPGLLKFGNSRGEDYDQRLVLVKSRVCTLKQDTNEDGEEDEDDTDGSDGNENEEGKDDDEEESLIEL
ncbi:hypothetical protein F4860DRAFT_501573 [Xylaria cubensis]|nr:hypothetical protein F4860DRAFT_501573 [Xylaria cubensis]